MLTLPPDAGARRLLAHSLLPKPGALIGGEWSYDLAGAPITHVEPATGEVTATLPSAAAADVDRAVRAAVRALDGWRGASAPERSAVLRSIASSIRAHSEELALLTTLDVGTPIEMARARMGTVPPGWFDYYAGWCDKLFGDTIPNVNQDEFSFTVHEPIGVVGKLVTWNSPIGGIQMAVAAALAAGCSVVIRPPELGPFTILRFAQLCEEAGVPSGLVNVVPAGPAGAEALVRHPQVAKVSFTGGPVTARAIQAAAAETLTPLVLELGGKSANLVFPDADLGRAIRHGASVCSLAGQACTLPSRLLVHEDVYDTVVDGIVASLQAQRQGDPFDSATTTGPVISEASMDRILAMIDRAVAAGARVRLGGKREGEKGWFVQPTVLEAVDPQSEIAQNEVFGPVLSVLRFRDEDEAVALANSTEYALAAYVHTSDLRRALRLTRRLDAGNVNINGAISPSGYHAPFGGRKISGYGKEGGREGILEFVSTKTVNMSLV